MLATTSGGVAITSLAKDFHFLSRCRIDLQSSSFRLGQERRILNRLLE